MSERKKLNNIVKDMEVCDLNNKTFKIAVLKKLNECKKTHIGSLMSSENKSTNKMNTLPNILKLLKEQREIMKMKNSKRSRMNQQVKEIEPTKWRKELVISKGERRQTHEHKKLKEFYKNYLTPSEKAI